MSRKLTHCTRCKREIGESSTHSDSRLLITSGKTFLKREQATKFSFRDYCGFCGAWLK